MGTSLTGKESMMDVSSLQVKYVDKWLKGGNVTGATFRMDHNVLYLDIEAKDPNTLRLPGVDVEGRLEGVPVRVISGDVLFPPNEVKQS